MSKLFIEDSTLSAIGDAIRAKDGSTAKMSPAQMVTAIGNIETGIEPEGTLGIENNGSYNVREYEYVAVDVLQGVFPTGELEITENGSHDVTNYATAVVNVASSGGEGGGSSHDFGKTVPIVRVAKTDNVVSPDEYNTTDYFDKDYLAKDTAQTSSGSIYRGFFFPQASSIKVKVWFQGVSSTYPRLDIYNYYGGTQIKSYTGRDSMIIEEFTITGNSAYFYFYTSTKTSGSFGYYAEVTPLDADGNALQERENPLEVNVPTAFFHACGLSNGSSAQYIQDVERQTLFLDNLDDYESVSLVFENRMPVVNVSYTARFGFRCRRGYHDWYVDRVSEQVDASADSDYIGADNRPVINNYRNSTCEVVIGVKDNTCVSIRPWVIATSTYAHYNLVELTSLKYN